MGYATKQYLKSHMASKHDEGRLQCDKCDYQSASKQHLKSHMAYKHAVGQIQCDKCDYQSDSKQALKKHCNSQHAQVEVDWINLKIIRQAVMSWISCLNCDQIVSNVQFCL